MPHKGKKGWIGVDPLWVDAHYGPDVARLAFQAPSLTYSAESVARKCEPDCQDRSIVVARIKRNRIENSWQGQA